MAKSGEAEPTSDTMARIFLGREATLMRNGSVTEPTMSAHL